MVIRHGRSGEFLGCSKFPKCRGTRSMPTGVKCPEGWRRHRRAPLEEARQGVLRLLQLSEVRLLVWDKPVAEVCPECGYVGAETKFTKTRGEYRRCLKCANEWDVVPSPETPEAVAV